MERVRRLRPEHGQFGASKSDPILLIPVQNTNVPHTLRKLPGRDAQCTIFPLDTSPALPQTPHRAGEPCHPLHLPALHELLPLARYRAGGRGRDRRDRRAHGDGRAGIHRPPHPPATRPPRPLPFGKAGRLMRVARWPRLPASKCKARAMPRLSERLELSRLAGKVRSRPVARSVMIGILAVWTLTFVLCSPQSHHDASDPTHS